MLARQDRLEFVPGSKYRYSSGGYLVLTTIIERVSGQSLPRFADDAFFRPLGMARTFVEDNYATTVAGRVESYRPAGSGRYERILKHFGDEFITRERASATHRQSIVRESGHAVRPCTPGLPADIRGQAAPRPDAAVALRPGLRTATGSPDQRTQAASPAPADP